MKKQLTIIFSLVSVALILAVSAAILSPTSFRPKAGNAGSVSLAMSPDKLNLGLNETATVDILVDSGGKQIDGFFIRLAYDSTKFKVLNGKLNSAYEEVMNWTTSPGHIGFSGILPPGTADGGTAGGVIASFEIQGLTKTDGSSITFSITNSRFQLVNGGDQFTVVAAPMATYCVASSATTCPALACTAGKPAIIYPIRGKKTLDPKFEIAFKSTLGCFPQEYKITLRNSAGGQICASSWLGGLVKYDAKDPATVKHHYALEFGCPDMVPGNYQAEVITRYQGRESEPDLANFTYANDSFAGSMPSNFIGAFGNTDVTIPSGYAGFRRAGYGRTDTYITTGVSPVSANSAFFSWGRCFTADFTPPVYRDFKECLGYNYRKFREMAINSGGIGSLSIDDVKAMLNYDWLHLNLGDFRRMVAGPNGKLGITWYGEDDCSAYAARDQVSWVFLYTTQKQNYGSFLQKTKGCFPNAKIIAGIYPRSMDGMVGYGDFGLSDEEEISQTCYQTRTALEWLTKGDVIGIEIYDNAPTKPGFEALDKTCARIASEILAGGDPEECHP